MLLNPPPDDWLMYSRTYDAQRYSPLNQINKQNAGRLTQVWANPLPPGTIEIIPIVHDGVMYIVILSRKRHLRFWGDLNQKFRAFDADTGKILWETALGGPIQNSTITYRVNGRQYVAVVTGLGAITANLFSQAGINPQRNNAIHAFALGN